ncbi:growth factor receptor-bound protein 10a isoform X3 [Tachysurus ichikawai]
MHSAQSAQLNLLHFQDNVDHTSSRGSASLIHFQQPSNPSSPNHPDDDVDLEALVNDMTSLSPYEGLYSFKTQHSDTVPLLHNGQFNRIALPPYPSNSRAKAGHSSAQKACRSQPVHILAVRRLQQEEQLVRPSSLPAIPNPFPELCSPTGSPILSTVSMPQPSDVQNFFPENMVAWCQESNGTIPPSQLLQNFLNSSRCPEIQGFLYMKETGRKSWKKLYMFLRRSGLYYSTKGMSKEPRHLQLLSDLEENSVFTMTTGKKVHNAPTDYQFCIKPTKGTTELKDLKMLCAEDEQSRTCWMTGFRVFKYGILLYQNYKIPHQSAVSNFTTPVRSVSENSLVAMDFSGRTGRVIDNPVEAMSAAMEEGHTWRKRSQRMNVSGNPSSPHPSSLNSVIHRTQLWFHGRIMREESHRMMMQQGQVDGLFLLRDSQSNPKAFVLTLCHHQKIRHFQILPYEEDGQIFFSLDDGSTKFTDLIHLVEFYQLNRGVLPCKLKHPCTMVAL